MAYPESSPLAEVRALLATNEQLIRSLVAELKETTIDTRTLTKSVSEIEGKLLLVENRLDRIDKDIDTEKSERLSAKHLVWAALLAATLAVVVPLVIRPGANYSPSVSAPAK
jgi:septal ring factor EnvC (AmiA/AmiB activator)